MKSISAIIIAVGVVTWAGSASASLIVDDNFDRADSTSLGNPQKGNAWNEQKTAGDGGAMISGNQLVLTNDETATGNANGRVYAYTSLAGLSGFNTTLSLNTDVVEWSFNMQQIRTDPAGFDTGNYGVAFVLAGSTPDFTLGNGYAVVLGQSLSVDPIRLARYVGGLDANANFTNIISSGDYANEYLNIRVTYKPGTNEWSLFGTSGASFSDPTLVTTQLGSTTVDSTHTGTSLANMGMLWSYSIGATQMSKFDNVKLSVIPEPTTVSVLGISLAAFLVRGRRKN